MSTAYDLKAQPAFGLMLQAQTALLKRDRIAGERISAQLQVLFPHKPFSSFGRMAQLQSLIFETGDSRPSSEFWLSAEENEKICEPILDDEQADLFELFICSAAEGLRGFEYLRQKSYFKALGSTGRAQDALKSILKRDPGFVDVHLGIGLYQYFRSYFTRKFSFLPFFRDQRNEGRLAVQKAASKAILVAPLARIALIVIADADKNANDALAKADVELLKFPNNIGLHVFRIGALRELKRWNDVIHECDLILRIDPSLVIYDYVAGKILAQNLKQNDRAATRLQKAMQHPDPAIRSKVKKMLDSLSSHP